MSGGKQFNREKLNSANGSVNVGGWKKVGEGVFNKITLKSLKDAVKEQCAEYERRRDALCGGFRRIGWNVPDSQGTMFAWAPIPKGFASSEEFCMELMEKTGVICTPGHSFGSLGEGYVRFALVLPVEKINEMIDVIDKSGVLKR